MILAIVQAPTATAPDLYCIPGDWPRYLNATFSPEARHLAAVNTALHGKNRESWKYQARGKLWEIQEAAAIPGLSWGELAILQKEAEKIARRAGLLTEARENGII